MIQNITEFREIECPFCRYKETSAISSEMVDEETGATAGNSIDSWDCLSCGESTSLVFIKRIKRRDKKKVDVTFDQITDAFDLCDQDHPYLLDIDKEDIAPLTDNDPEDLKEAIETNPERFVAIPPKNTDDEYSLMESFIHEIGEHNGFTTIASRLEIAINQKKPFRNFKDAIIEFPIIQERWFSFHHHVTMEKACAWLCENNLKCLGREHGKKVRTMSH